MEKREEYAWLTLAVLGFLASAAFMLAHAVNTAEARPEVCTNYPHECAAAVTEWRM